MNSQTLGVARSRGAHPAGGTEAGVFRSYDTSRYRIADAGRLRRSAIETLIWV
jgi:hypothetical protein